jgi:choline dehydrogenase-like flavoprotein
MNPIENGGSSRSFTRSGVSTPSLKEYDAVVLGSGEGAKYIAWTLAKQGNSVAVIERRYIGGSCPNIACLPSKNVIHSASARSGIPPTTNRLVESPWATRWTPCCGQGAHLIMSLRGVYSQHRKRRQIGEAAAKEHLAPLPGAGFQAPRGSPVGRREQ